MASSCLRKAALVEAISVDSGCLATIISPLAHARDQTSATFVLPKQDNRCRAASMILRHAATLPGKGSAAINNGDEDKLADGSSPRPLPAYAISYPSSPSSAETPHRCNACPLRSTALWGRSDLLRAISSTSTKMCARGKTTTINRCNDQPTQVSPASPMFGLPSDGLSGRVRAPPR